MPERASFGTVAPGTRRSMKANTRRDTRPEVAVRRLLHAHGLRFRVDYPVATDERAIRVDIAFPARRLAVFVDGCFWHGCPEHATMPRKNRDYWEPKLDRNRARDARQTALLETAGWHVVRFWTHVPAETICRDVEDMLRGGDERADLGADGRVEDQAASE